MARKHLINWGLNMNKPSYAHRSMRHKAYGLRAQGLTLAKIGEYVGVSKERVRQIVLKVRREKINESAKAMADIELVLDKLNRLASFSPIDSGNEPMFVDVTGSHLKLINTDETVATVISVKQVKTVSRAQAMTMNRELMKGARGLSPTDYIIHGAILASPPQE